MGSKISAKGIMQIIIRLLHNKEQIGQVLEYLDASELEAGIIGLHQDLLNRTFKMDIMNRADIEDYDISFSSGEIRVNVDKFIKVMMLEKVLKIKLTLTEPDLAFGSAGHYFFAKYTVDIEGVPAILEKMPGGNSIKDTIVATLLKNGTKDLPWIQVVNDRLYIDFLKIEGFEKLRKEGIYGVDVINTLELNKLESKNNKLQLAYKLLD